MKLRSLPPVRNPVMLVPGENRISFSGFHMEWLGSGTEALAYSLLHKRNIVSKCRSRGDVIVPGYCCPDLLSAIHYVGCRPVIVDIGENDPGYDLKALENALTDSTLAVIAVNFLGITEQLGAIKKLIEGTEIALIEDNAQWFPDTIGNVNFSGDYVTFSFGRGKAVSLLGGGLVLHKEGSPLSLTLKKNQNQFLYPLKSTIFNIVTLPAFYYWVEKAPFLNLGRTEYHKLTDVLAMSDQQQRLVDCNVRKYQAMNRANEIALLQSQTLSSTNLLTQVLQSDRKKRLLRYPLLMRSVEDKNKALSRLKASGLGGSAMYESELTQVSGVRKFLDRDFSLPNAASFAQRFLTLPIHDLVKPKEVELMLDVVCGN